MKQSDAASIQRDLFYMALHQKKDGITFILYNGDRIVKRGVAMTNDRCEFQASLEIVLLSIVVIASCDERVNEQWISELNDESEKTWWTVNKCCLSSLDLHHLIDKGFMKKWATTPLRLETMKNMILGFKPSVLASASPGS